MVKILIGCKYYVRYLNKKDFEIVLAGIEPNFKIMYNCIRELLTVFECPA